MLSAYSVVIECDCPRNPLRPKEGLAFGLVFSREKVAGIV
jgi:hypothetical protein